MIKAFKFSVNGREQRDSDKENLNQIETELLCHNKPNITQDSWTVEAKAKDCLHQLSDIDCNMINFRQGQANLGSPKQPLWGNFSPWVQKPDILKVKRQINRPFPKSTKKLAKRRSQAELKSLAEVGATHGIYNHHLQCKTEEKEEIHEKCWSSILRYPSEKFQKIELELSSNTEQVEKQRPKRKLELIKKIPSHKNSIGFSSKKRCLNEEFRDSKTEFVACLLRNPKETKSVFIPEGNKNLNISYEDYLRRVSASQDTECCRQASKLKNEILTTIEKEVVLCMAPKKPDKKWCHNNRHFKVKKRQSTCQSRKEEVSQSINPVSKMLYEKFQRAINPPKRKRTAY